tara:strand:- start:133 stop:1020 length:888 start_codon:yes stop_codon:yes gene_type:complete
MPKKKTNTELINNYLEHIKNEKKVSQGTITTYKNVGESLPFNLLSNQTTIIKKLKELYSNANTLQLYLNMIILVRRFDDEETDKLIKLRNSLKDEIVKIRKQGLDKLDQKLPSFDYIKTELDNLNGIRYILNYLIINHGLRNKDMNLKMVKTLPAIPDRTENYILLKPKEVLLNINDYKTEDKYGSKQLRIKDMKFIEELKKLNLKPNDYLFAKKDKSKITNTSTFNDKILNLTIDRYGQNRLFKIVIKDLLNNKSFDKLEELSNSRGTSLEVLLKSYNLENGIENDKNDKVKED